MFSWPHSVQRGHEGNPTHTSSKTTREGILFENSERSPRVRNSTEFKLTLARSPAHRHRQVQRASWRHLEPERRVSRNSGGRVSRSNRPVHSAQRSSPTRLASASGTATGMPKVQPGNPDWVDWVQELVDQAEAASSKAAQTYKKVSLSMSNHVPVRELTESTRIHAIQAAHSLRSCPITFRHPEQALQLNGVGPKIVAHLVKKVKEQCDSQGLPMPDRGEVSQSCRNRRTRGLTAALLLLFRASGTRFASQGQQGGRTESCARQAHGESSCRFGRRS